MATLRFIGIWKGYENVGPSISNSAAKWFALFLHTYCHSSEEEGTEWVMIRRSNTQIRKYSLLFIINIVSSNSKIKPKYVCDVYSNLPLFLSQTLEPKPKGLCVETKYTCLNAQSSHAWGETQAMDAVQAQRAEQIIVKHLSCNDSCLQSLWQQVLLSFHFCVLG